MKTWKMHWDRQLYKALEHQYQMGLEALNENLPEIKVELVFRYSNTIYFLVVYMQKRNLKFRNCPAFIVVILCSFSCVWVIIVLDMFQSEICFEFDLKLRYLSYKNIFELNFGKPLLPYQIIKNTQFMASFAACPQECY